MRVLVMRRTNKTKRLRIYFKRDELNSHGKHGKVWYPFGHREITLCYFLRDDMARIWISVCDDWVSSVLSSPLVNQEIELAKERQLYREYYDVRALALRENRWRRSLLLSTCEEWANSYDLTFKYGF